MLTSKCRKYTSHIWNYEDRIKKKRLMLLKANKVEKIRYEASIKGMELKIKQWRKEMVKAEVISNKTVAIGNLVSTFMGMNVRSSRNSTDPKMEVARCIFFRYCLEEGVPGDYLAEYTGYKDRELASTKRKAFINSFKTTPENKELWMRFKEYVERQSQCTKEDGDTF